MDLDQQVNKIKVRKITNKDIEDCYNLYMRSYNKNNSIPKYVNNDVFYVATLDNVIVGMVQVDYIDLPFENEKIAYINSVCVDPNYQGKSIAKKLMVEVLNVCKKDGCNKSILTSNNRKEIAHKLYKSLGYKIYDTNVFVKEL